MNDRIPYDQQLARLLIKPLTRTPLHANHLTTLNLLLGLAAATLFAFCIEKLAWLAALLFMLAVFTDHMDGELARAKNQGSDFGYRYDYIAGATAYTLLFIAIGYGLYSASGQVVMLVLGLLAGLSNPVILMLRMRTEDKFGRVAVQHPAMGGFEIEDFIYLIGPITWLLGIRWFFLPFALGTLGYLLWTIVKYSGKPGG